MSNSLKNVVYLISAPLSQRDYMRFGIDTWTKRGWCVSVFDFTKILNKTYFEYVNGDALSVSHLSGLCTFETLDEAKNKILNIKNKTVFIDFLGGNSFEQSFRKLAKQRGVIVQLNLGCIPAIESSLFKKIQKIIIKPSALMSFIKRKIVTRKKNDPDYYVVGGTKSEQSALNANLKVIRAHNFDFDFFLNDKSLDEAKKSYVLFLDEDACFHPDYILLGMVPAATSERYFPSVNSGLGAISNMLSSSVVIAAHPRSNHKMLSEAYGFKVIKDSTYDLIKNAKLVVAHGSTSIQIAVLFRKPILLVTTDQLENSEVSNTYRAFRAALEKSVVNFDHFTNSFDLQTEIYVDNQVYDRYIETYIKQKNSPMESSWTIIINELEKDFTTA